MHAKARGPVAAKGRRLSGWMGREDEEDEDEEEKLQRFLYVAHGLSSGRRCFSRSPARALVLSVHPALA